MSRQSSDCRLILQPRQTEHHESCKNRRVAISSSVATKCHTRQSPHHTRHRLLSDRPLQTEKSTGKRPIPDRKRLSGLDDPVCRLRIPNHGTIGRCLRSTHSGTRLRPSIPPQELRHPICRSLKTEPVTVRSGGPEDYTADGPGVDSPQTDPERIQRHEALLGVSSRSEPGPDEHFLPEAFIQA